jgi:hypothetical protein
MHWIQKFASKTLNPKPWILNPKPEALNFGQIATADVSTAALTRVLNFGLDHGAFLAQQRDGRGGDCAADMKTRGTDETTWCAVQKLQLHAVAEVEAEAEA